MEAIMIKLQEAKRIRDEKIRQEQIRRQKLFQLHVQRTQKQRQQFSILLKELNLKHIQKQGEARAVERLFNKWKQQVEKIK